MLKVFLIFGMIVMLLIAFYPRKVVYKPGGLRWNHFYLVGFQKDKKPDYFYIRSITRLNADQIKIIVNVPKEYIDDCTEHFPYGDKKEELLTPYFPMLKKE